MSQPDPQEHAERVLIVEAEARRLDQFVSTALGPQTSRSQVARLIKAGRVTLNGAAVRASAAIHAGDRIEISPPRPAHPVGQAPDPPAIEVLFSDPELIVVNKPAGMTVHAAPGHPHSTLVDALLARFPELATMVEPDGLMRPGIVHRLDKETSGVMVVARTPLARMALSRQFHDRAVRKLYIAIVHGIVPQEHFVVARPVGRHPTERKRMSVHSRHPRAATTRFRVLYYFRERQPPLTVLRAQPETGRTHQIRVHLSSVGHPCLGDSLYGGRRMSAEAGWQSGRQALHALALALNHPRTNERLEFIAALPADMAEFLAPEKMTGGCSLTSRWVAGE